MAGFSLSQSYHLPRSIYMYFLVEIADIGMIRLKNRGKSEVSDVSTTSGCHGMTYPPWFSVKAMYFLLYGSLGAALTYISIYFSKRGLSAVQIGQVELVFTLVSALSRPLFGSIADRTRRHKIVLGLCILVATIFTYALNFVRPESPPLVRYDVTLTCNAVENQFLFKSCNKDSISILTNMSNIGPDFMLHHADLGFRDNCSSVNKLCQVTCSNFVSRKFIPEKGELTEPFSDLGLRISSIRNDTRQGCFNFPLTVSPTHSHVTLACNNSVGMPCQIDCSCSKNKTEIDAQNFVYGPKIEDDSEKWSVFVTMLLLRGIGAIPFGPSISLADSIAYDIMGHRHRNLWGQQRLFGTIAFGLVAGITGLLIDYFDSFDVMFYALGSFGVGAALVSLFWLPRKLAAPPKSEESVILTGTTQRSMPFCTAICSVFCVPLYSISCVVALASGMLMSVIYVVWPIYQTTDLLSEKWMVGAAMSVCCVIEIPSLFFAGHIVQRLGECVCFLLMFAAFAFRYLAYAYLTPSYDWLVLPLQVLHIFCFAFYYTAATRFAAAVAPLGTSATVQAILQACYFGFGMGLGFLVSSSIYQAFGGHAAFLIYSAFSAASFILLFVLYLAYLRNALARVKNNSPPMEGSYSPHLNPDASYVDEEERDEAKKPLPDDQLDVGSSPHYNEL